MKSWGSEVSSFLADRGVRKFLETEREEAIEAVAIGLGLPFYPKGNREFFEKTENVQFIKSFSRGFKSHHFNKYGAPRINNLIWKVDNNIEIAYFDFRIFEGGSGDSDPRSFYSVAYFRSKQIDSPQFRIRKTNFFERAINIFRSTVTFNETHPKFHKKYFVTGKDESKIKSLLNVDFLEHTTKYWPPKMLEISGSEDHMTFKAYEIVPDHIENFVNENMKSMMLLWPIT